MRTTLATRVAGAALAGGVAVTGLAVLPTAALAAPGAPSAVASLTVAPGVAIAARPPGCRNPTPYRKNPNCTHTTSQSADTVQRGGEFKLSFTKLSTGTKVTVTIDGVVRNLTQTADRNGKAVFRITIPSDARLGRTTITIKGTNGDGSRFTERRGLTITERGANVRGVSLNRDGSPVAEPVTVPQRGLAFTGAEIGTAVGLGLVLLGGGATLVLVSRRRKAPAA